MIFKGLDASLCRHDRMVYQLRTMFTFLDAQRKQHAACYNKWKMRDIGLASKACQPAIL